MTSCHVLLKMSRVQLEMNIPNYVCEQQKDTSPSPSSALMWRVSTLRSGPQARKPCPLMRNVPEPVSLEIPPTVPSLWTDFGARAVSFESLLYFLLENGVVDSFVLFQCPPKIHGESYSFPGRDTWGRGGGRPVSLASLISYHLSGVNQVATLPNPSAKSTIKLHDKKKKLLTW